ncbi:hypothetical protein Tco_0439494 [Tanacetum coccineum]
MPCLHRWIKDMITRIASVAFLVSESCASFGLLLVVPGKFQGYETSEEEPVEQPRRHDLYGFVDHPQLQQGNPMNEFAPHRLPQPEGNMNGWLMEDEEELERNEVDSDLESTASSKPKHVELEDTCESGSRPNPNSAEDVPDYPFNSKLRYA